MTRQTAFNIQIIFVRDVAVPVLAYHTSRIITPVSAHMELIS